VSLHMDTVHNIDATFGDGVLTFRPTLFSYDQVNDLSLDMAEM